MSLFNRNVKNGKESKAEENGKNGNGTVNGNGLRARIAENAQRFMPHMIKEALPYFVQARQSREGREKLIEKAKEIAYEQAEYTTVYYTHRTEKRNYSG